MDDVTRERIESAHERALEVAESIDPAAGDTEAEKALAEAMIQLRAEIPGRDGAPDWLGHTREYRSRAQEIHNSIRGDAPSVQRLKGRLRQHYIRLLPQMIESHELAAALERSEESPLPLDGEFFDDLGVYVSEKGRRSTSDAEAQVLVIVAARLLELVDPSTLSRVGAHSLTLTLDQTVVQQVSRLREAVKPA